jgi:hypothetical protein
VNSFGKNTEGMGTRENFGASRSIINFRNLEGSSVLPRHNRAKFSLCVWNDDLSLNNNSNNGKSEKKIRTAKFRNIPDSNPIPEKLKNP